MKKPKLVKEGKVTNGYACAKCGLFYSRPKSKSQYYMCECGYENDPNGELTESKIIYLREQQMDAVEELKEKSLHKDYAVEELKVITEEHYKNIFFPQGLFIKDAYDKFYSFIDKSAEHMQKLIREKNKGYASTGEKDPYCNFRWKTETTLAVYLNSKMSRLKSCINNGSSDADMFEVFRDIAGYALIGMAWLQDEKGFKPE